MDLDLRRVRYFLIVADELHFGRAAERLRIAQPALSRQVAALERELGVTLLDRSTRHVSLTHAGMAFMAEVRPIVDAADAAVRRVRLGQRGTSSLVVGFMPGLSVRHAVGEVLAQFPSASVELRELDWTNQAQMVRDGTVDVAVARRPFDANGLRVQDVAVERRGVLLPADDGLASRRSVSIRDVADRPVIRHRHGGPWDDYWTVNPRPDGSAPVPGPVVETVPEKLAIVANGLAVTFLPRSASRAYVHPDVTWVPLHDIDDSRISCVWLKGRTGRLVSAFAIAVNSSPQSVVGRSERTMRVAGDLPTEDIA